MELPSKLLEQITHNKKPRIEEGKLISMDISTHEEQLSQLLQTNNKRYKLALTFLTGYNGNFNVTSKNIKFYFTVSNNDEDFTQNRISPAAYEIESLKDEIRRNIIEGAYFTEATYPFKIKPNFSTLGSIVKISSTINGTQIAFTPDHGIRDLIGFKPKVIHE